MRKALLNILLLVMYEFIFYYFYRYFQKYHDSSPGFGAVCGLFLVIGFHVVFIVTLLRRVTNLTLLPVFSSSSGTNKLVYMAIALPFFIYALIYFNKEKTASILEEYDSKKNIFNLLHFLFFFVITLGPLIGTILLLRK